MVLTDRTQDIKGGADMKSKNTPETIDHILDRISEGESIVKICGLDRADSMPSAVLWYRWLDEDAELVKRYARACEARAEQIFEEILDISDDGALDLVANEDGSERLNSEHIQRSRLRVDSRKWMLSKLQPKKYGDKLDLNHESAGGTMTPHVIERVIVMPDKK